MAVASINNSQAKNYSYCRSGLKKQSKHFRFPRVILTVVQKYRLARSLKNCSNTSLAVNGSKKEEEKTTIRLRIGGLTLYITRYSKFRAVPHRWICT
jgi:hypothetical protein